MKNETNYTARIASPTQFCAKFIMSLIRTMYFTLNSIRDLGTQSCSLVMIFYLLQSLLFGSVVACNLSTLGKLVGWLELKFFVQGLGAII